MMMVRKWDNFLIDSMQRAYLWLLDWTGVYVGTLLLFTFVATLVLRGFNWWNWAELFGLVLMLAWCGWKYSQQATDRIELFNASSEYNRTSWLRDCLNVMLVMSAVIAIVKNQWGEIGAETLWFVMGYLMTVKLRKREPKEFFEGKGATNEC